MPMEIHEDKIIMRAGKYDFNGVTKEAHAYVVCYRGTVYGLFASEQSAQNYAKTKSAEGAEIIRMRIDT